MTFFTQINIKKCHELLLLISVSLLLYYLLIVWACLLCSSSTGQAISGLISKKIAHFKDLAPVSAESSRALGYINSSDPEALQEKGRNKTGTKACVLCARS